jgi:hypothetical protein
MFAFLVFSESLVSRLAYCVSLSAGSLSLSLVLSFDSYFSCLVAKSNGSLWIRFIEGVAITVAMRVSSLLYYRPVDEMS